MTLSFRRLCLIPILIVVNSTFAQLTDIARIEYSFIPKSDSEDRYTRLRALLNYPIELKEDTYFVVGGEYNNILLDLNDSYPFDRSLFETIHVIDLNLGYTFKTKKGLRWGAKFNPRIASTLNSKLTIDDFFLNGGVYVINDRRKDENLKRPFRLILGLTYNATAGVPFPLPFVSYFRRPTKKYSFNLGVPKSNIKYYFNEKNEVQLFVGLDGYFAHLQRPQQVLGRQVDNISMSVVVLGLGYEYNFTKHLLAYFYTGYTLRMNNILRNEDQDEVFRLDDLNAFYLRSGLKFKI
ncbi:MAG: DUF6268 family outer membrane beta-barrel protein [Bacteroidota bacterium]